MPISISTGFRLTVRLRMTRLTCRLRRVGLVFTPRRFNSFFSVLTVYRWMRGLVERFARVRLAAFFLRAVVRFTNRPFEFRNRRGFLTLTTFRVTAMIQFISPFR